MSRLRQRAINYEKQKRSKVITEETKPRVKRKRRVLEKYDADVVTETEVKHIYNFILVLLNSVI